jgi:hypothetical protein
MSTQKEKDTAGEIEARPHRLRLPGFIRDEEIGLGDVIKKITYKMGMKPCAGCEKRAAAFNHWVRFTK